MERFINQCLNDAANELICLITGIDLQEYERTLAKITEQANQIK